METVTERQKEEAAQQQAYAVRNAASTPSTIDDTPQLAWAAADDAWRIQKYKNTTESTQLATLKLLMRGRNTLVIELCLHRVFLWCVGAPDRSQTATEQG